MVSITEQGEITPRALLFNLDFLSSVVSILTNQGEAMNKGVPN